MITANIDKQTLDRLTRTFAATEQQLERAALRAVNSTAKWAHANLKRQFLAELSAEGLTLANKRVMKRLQLMRASKGRLFAAVWLGLNDFPAIFLGRGVRTGEGRVIRGRLFRQAFLAQMKSGHEGIFRRRGVDRLPIRTEPAEHHVRPEALARRIDRALQQEFLIRFERELEYELR